eukprot:366140-Chlamydomonas_euryale.AAC.3
MSGPAASVDEAAATAVSTGAAAATAAKASTSAAAAAARCRQRFAMPLRDGGSDGGGAAAARCARGGRDLACTCAGCMRLRYALQLWRVAAVALARWLTVRSRQGQKRQRRRYGRIMPDRRRAEDARRGHGRGCAFMGLTRGSLQANWPGG